MKYLEECLTLGDWLSQDDCRALYKYFLESKKFIEAQSYGRLKFVSDVSPKVFRINKNSSVYGLIADGQGDGMQLIQDAVAAADPETDFSKYDFLRIF